MEVFVDSDVVISSLLSDSGAAYLLLHTDTIVPLISSLSKKEIEIVIKRLGINKNEFEEPPDRLRVIPLTLSMGKIRTNFQKYVLDVHDAHIVAGAKAAGVRFLITYNVKDFKIERIKEDFNLIVLTPGQFIQYLRSLK